jgi:hypothetical protein
VTVSLRRATTARTLAVALAVSGAPRIALALP